MDPQLYSQLRQTILIANSTGVNTYGELQYGASTSARARVVDKVQWVKNDLGEKLLSSKALIIPASDDVRINSRIYLPGETTSNDDGWVPMAVALRIGEAGSSDHWKVWLGNIGGE